MILFLQNAWPRDDGIATVIILENARRFQEMARRSTIR